MKQKTSSMSLKSVGKVISASDRRRIYRFAVARVAANLLDIVGLAGIALLATSFGAFASGGGPIAPLDIPLIGEIVINESAAVVVALLIAVTFLVKSGFSIWLNLKTALFVASLEAGFSKKLAGDYFSGGSEGEGGFEDSLSGFQNVATDSTLALSTFVNARIAAISESALLLAMAVTFILVNPIAAVAMFVYLLAVLWALARVVTSKIRSNGKNQLKGSEIALSTSRDLFGTRREARASGVLVSWVDQFGEGRRVSASSSAIIYTLNGLPRYVIETSLILGIFAFLAGIVVFSDLPSQAVTIGVFMAGGLRLVASLLPLQAAINSMIDGANRGSLALERLTKIQMRTKPQPDTAVLPDRDSALALELKGVGFAFDPSVPVVQDVSFSVEPGQKVALVGPSGAGKTTCFELSTGFRLPDSGELLLGGKAPRDVLDGGNGQIGIVPQRPHLVTGTVAENVTLSSPDQADLSRVSQVLQIAGLASFASSENLKQQVSPDAGQFSGGEIQRLGLARALYRKPGILFLDEATSALDAQTESEINDVLDSLRGEMTIVLIAHRLSTVKNADKIIYLDKGRVVAEGTFRELQKKVPDFEKAVKLMGLES